MEVQNNMKTNKKSNEDLVKKQSKIKKENIQEL